MSIGYRPKGESGPMYHPDRDYAYITPTLMRMAVERLESEALSPEAQEWKQANNITAVEIEELAAALARAQRDFVNGADPVTSFEHALARRDWFDIRYPARQFLFSVIGEVFCAAWFKAVREVTRKNEESPAAPQIADFMASVRPFVGLGADAAKTHPAAVRAAALALQNDVLQSRLQTVYARLQEVEAQLAASPAPSPTQENKPASLWLRIQRRILRALDVE